MNSPLPQEQTVTEHPTIGRMPNTALTQVQERLLRRAFAGSAEIFVEQTFRSGYSGAFAYLVSRTGQAPVVVKMAHPFELRHEYNAYHAWVAETAPQNTTRLQGELLVSEDGQLGLIAYTFAGGDSRIRANNLAHYYQTHKGAATAAVIDRIFRVYGRQWWANHQLNRLVMGEVYDRLLPVHLQLTTTQTPLAEVYTLQAGALDPAQMRTLQPGQCVLLHNFEVSKVRPGSLTLQGGPPPGVRAATVRVRLEGAYPADIHLGDRLPPQYALVTATRQLLLTEAAQMALPAPDLSDTHFCYEAQRYLNPLHNLEELLDSRYDAKFSIIHGDLNLQNILVDSVTGFAWLIDFGETRRGPVLLDLQRLEVQVLTKLLPPCLPQDRLNPSCVAPLLAALHTLAPAPLAPLPALQEPYTILITLRQLALQYLVDNHDWAEYYRGLIVALLGALKYDELDVTARLLALIGAATAQHLLDLPLFAPIPISEQPPAPGDSPYKGLQYFDVTDADLFFGREQLTAELVACLQSQRFLAVVGASGSGKSSLVRAGLAPLLQRSATLVDVALPSSGSDRWSIHIITPTAHPLESLALSLTRGSASMLATTTLVDDLARDARTLHLYVRKLLAGGAPSDQNKRLLLIVDQFEELFTLCHDKAERKAFIDNLMTAVDTDGPLVAVITLRADFYAYCAEFDNLRAHLARFQKYIGPMKQDELRFAIEEPARRNGWSFEVGLVDLLLKDVGHEPGALPLLSHALLETWQRRRGRLLTMSGYTESGRVQGAIAQTAETVFQHDLTAKQRLYAKNIFLRLTELGEGAHDTRRRVMLQSLIANPAARPTVEAVIKLLTDARLLTTDGVGNDTAVEVAHEALIREWPTLREWLTESREGLRIHRQLSDATQEWEKLQRDPEALYRGVRLEQAQQWADEHLDQLNRVEAEFLYQSQAAVEAANQAMATARQRELAQAQALAAEQRRVAEEQQQRAEEQRHRAEEQTAAAKRLLHLVIALVAVFLIAISAAIYALAAQARADQKALEAHAQAQLAQSEKARADQKTQDAENALLQANKQAQLAQSEKARADQKTQDAEDALFQANKQKQIARAAIARADKLAQYAHQAQSAAEQAARRAQAGEMAANVQVELVKPVPDPSLALLLALQAVTITAADVAVLPRALWALDAAVRAAPPWRRTLGGHAKGVRAVAFSPDSERIVTASWDQTASVWDTATGERLFSLTGHTGGVLAAAYGRNPAGQTRLATASADKTALIWSASGQPLFALTGHTDTVNAVAFSPDGQWIATASADNSVRLWDAAGTPLHTLTGHNRGVTGVAFTANAGSLRLATASDDKTVRIWDIHTKEQLFQFDHPEGVLAVAFSPDMGQIATAGADGAVRLWQTEADDPGRVIGNHVGSVWSVAYSPDGNYVISAGADKSARIWHVQTGASLLPLTGHTDAVWAATFSPTGAAIATGSADHSARLWDFLPDQPLLTLSNRSDWFFDAVFSPDGRHIATASWDQIARIWNAATGVEELALRGHTGGLLTVAYSADGAYLVTASDDKTARIWDARSGALRQTLQGHTDRVWSAHFSTTAQRVVTSSRDGTVRIWETATGALIQTLTGHTGTVWVAKFNPNGTKILTSASDNTVRLWDAESGRELQHVGKQRDGVLFADFSPDGVQIAIAYNNGTADIWDLATNQEVQRLIGHVGEIRSIAFDPTSSLLLTGGSDGTVRLWDKQSGEELLQLSGHAGGVRSVAFSPDGKRVISASEDRTVRTWVTDVQTLIALALAHIQRDPPSFTPEEQRRFGVE